MNKKDVTEFFDGLADSWDAYMVKMQPRIDAILDAAEVTEDKTVLDVACGTGVLIPDYVNRKVKRCVAVDISAKMIEIAKSKFGGYENVEFLCADAENLDLPDKFDCVVIYNAFPHFINRTLLFETLSALLDANGRITVAHGMSRETLLKHHSGKAKNVSSVLPEAEELAELMKPYFNVDIKTSTDEIYIVSAVKRHVTEQF